MIISMILIAILLLTIALFIFITYIDYRLIKNKSRLSTIAIQLIYSLLGIAAGTIIAAFIKLA